jgi:hypothetical protein
MQSFAFRCYDLPFSDDRPAETFGKLRMLLRDEFLTPLRYYK